MAQRAERDPREGRRPLMRIPNWYKDGSFRYNWRCGLGFLPGIILMGIVCGKTFIAVALFCVMVNLLIHSLGYDMFEMVTIVGSILLCQIVNIYCMAPLIWHSVINIPLFCIFHLFIAVVGLWTVMQNEEFLKQDPRINLLMEKGLFIGIPALNLVMISWITTLLLGKEMLPLATAFTGISLISLFIVPLQSSFVKPGTPPGEGLIIPRTIGLLFLLLMVLLPGVIYSALHSTIVFSTTEELLMSQLFFVAPTFVVTLLETQGVFGWLGEVNPRAVYIVRWITGIFTMGSLSILLYRQPASTNIPTLSIPILFTFLGLTSSLDNEDHKPSLLSIILATISALLYFTAALELPWNITYFFSLLSVPLSGVQLILLLLALLSLFLLLGWKKDLTLLWPTYHALFVGCEFVLNNDGFYHLSLLLTTAIAAIVLCLRLHRVGRLPLPLTILCVCLHGIKLSQFLPMPVYSSNSFIVSLGGSLILSLSFLKLTTSDTLSLRLLMTLCGLVAVGLCFCIQSIASPLLLAITHRPPSTPDLAAFVCILSGFTVKQFLHRVKETPAQKASHVLPPSLFFIAVLLWLLQPEFDLFEVSKAVSVVLLHHADVNKYMGQIITSEQIALIAWGTIIKWVVILYASLTVASISLKTCLPVATIQAAGSLLGSSLGVLVSVMLAHHPPLSYIGCLYALNGLSIGFMLSLIYLKTTGSSAWFERLMLGVLVVLCFVTIATEWMSLPSHIAESVPIPSGIMYVAIFLSIAVSTKLKSIIIEGGRPFLPIVCNISCLLSFLLAVSVHIPIHLDKAIVVSLASCVMLLAQEDGVIIPRTSGLFLVPSLVLSSLTLFVIAMQRITEDLAQSFTFIRCLELICLLGSVPGHIKFLYCLWKSTPFRYTVISLILYLFPNAVLAQFGGSVNVVFGSSAVLCFSLLAISEFQTIRTI